MPKLLPLKSEKLVSIVTKLGFIERRQKGSHKTFYHPDGRVLTIAFHRGKEIPISLLNKIIKQDLKMNKTSFHKLL